MNCTIKYFSFATALLLSFTFFTYLYDVISVRNSEILSSSSLNSATVAQEQKTSPPFPNDKLENIFWFVQITDLHISKFYDPPRKSQLLDFCKSDLQLIKPEVVLVTGDLTDAKHANSQGSEQYVEEWQDYDSILRKSGVLNRTVWLDIRGNHDAFNIPYLKNHLNLYQKYSHQGKKHLTSYYYEHKKSFGTYSFIGMDACPDPGPKRPFNFFGFVRKKEFNILTNFKLAADKTNKTVWFGHYPSSIIHSPDPGIRHLMRDAVAYVCGHLHTLGGLVPHMYAMQKNGFLELELGDWKENRKFRLLAFDHDMLSFVDQRFDEWPVVLVTNPKNILYTMPAKEPTGRMALSSHIRILVFSPSPIKFVEVNINGERLGNAKHVKGPLYVLKWNSESYIKGLFHLTVNVKDNAGRLRTVNQPFSLDNTRLTFKILPRLILMWNMSTFVKLMFWITWLISFTPLLVLKMLAVPLAVPSHFSGCLVTFLQRWMNRIYLVSVTNCIFWPLAFYYVYIAIGPWFIGYLLDDHIGICFVFGVYVDGSLLPMHSTYVMGLLLILFFVVPLTMCLGINLERNAMPSPHPLHTKSRFYKYISEHWAMTLLFVITVYCAWTGIYWAYGTMAFLLGPVKTWNIILQLALWITSMRCHPAAQISNGFVIVPGSPSLRTSRLS